MVSCVSIGDRCRKTNGEMTHQLGEEIADSAVGDISSKSIKGKSPGQWVQQGFFELVHFKVFISNALLVDAHSLNGQDPVSWLQPPSSELVVWYNEPENHAEHSGQAAIDEEHNFPRSDCRAVLSRADGNSIGYQSAKDLSEAVEREPDSGSCSLFFLGPPLRGDESPAGSDAGFKDTQ